MLTANIMLRRIDGQQTAPESAAQLALLQHANGWRVVPRDGESFKKALFLVESRLPEPNIVAAGVNHTLFVEKSGRLVSFGEGILGQLGQGEGMMSGMSGHETVTKFRILTGRPPATTSAAQSATSAVMKNTAVFMVPISSLFLLGRR